jgi:uncharacterized repeat protein (TIGR01451 family)
LVSRFATRCLVAVIAVTCCALAAGCLSGNPSYFPYLLPVGDTALQTHAKPAGSGYFADFDPYACRIVVRPEVCTAPIRGSQVFIATVYDGEGNPRRKRRVEWMVEGPGTIVEVDESGYLPGRGMKIDNKYAFSHTDYFEHCIGRGRDEFNVGPGQTWCLVSSAVEGETTVVAYCPAINDWEKNRAYAKLTWIDANLHFPPPVTTRAGGDYTLNTTIQRASDRGVGYRVRYRIVDGPAAALTAGAGGEVSSVTEAIAPVSEDGCGRVKVTQPLPVTGTNRIAIDLVKPDPDHPGQFTVVSQGETRVTWQDPRLEVAVTAPKTVAVNQEVSATYTISAPAKADSQGITLTAHVPDEMVLVSTNPKATVDESTLIWSLPASTGGKTQSVTAVFRPVRLASASLAADARTADGMTGHGICPVVIAEAKLLLKLEGPSSCVVGETLSFRVTVTNTGDGAATGIHVQGRFDEGLETTAKATKVEETISSLGAGQSKTITVPLVAKGNGKYGVEFSASGDGGVSAVSKSATVDVKQIQLAISTHGPARGYVGQEVTWQLVVRNSGDIPVNNVVVKATLPPEIDFAKATEGGKLTGKQIIWDLGSAPAKQERTLALTGVCNAVASRAIVTSTVTATPAGDGNKSGQSASRGKSVGSDRPVETAIEIVGVPALQLSVKDSADPVAVGQSLTYLVRVKNAGTVAAKNVVVVGNIIAPVRKSMTLTRGTGPGAAAKTDGEKVTFPPLDSLAPGAEASFVIEATAENSGDVRFEVLVQSASQAKAIRASESTRILTPDSRNR